MSFSLFPSFPPVQKYQPRANSSLCTGKSPEINHEVTLTCFVTPILRWLGPAPLRIRANQRSSITAKPVRRLSARRAIQHGWPRTCEQVIRRATETDRQRDHFLSQRRPHERRLAETGSWIQRSAKIQRRFSVANVRPRNWLRSFDAEGRPESQTGFDQRIQRRHELASGLETGRTAESKIAGLGARGFDSRSRT